ncbi:Prefoldin subunit [Lachnellula occidentalis]|uniref:Prefoldin subunit n=1 Tax=Lachnellula occidentalis TaxID=215460 RepID=A0A8H8S180_9HELO|nr:Prefoldin subunit [Lachnellula occidentalis]
MVSTTKEKAIISFQLTAGNAMLTALVHRLVLDTLEPLPVDRKCFRMINGVLVERTVKDVVPALKTNSEGLKKVLEELMKTYRSKQSEMETWKKKHNIQGNCLSIEALITGLGKLGFPYHGDLMTYCMEINGVSVLRQWHVEMCGVWRARRIKSNVIYRVLLYCRGSEIQYPGNVATTVIFASNIDGKARQGKARQFPRILWKS